MVVYNDLLVRLVVLQPEARWLPCLRSPVVLFGPMSVGLGAVVFRYPLLVRH